MIWFILMGIFYLIVGIFWLYQACNVKKGKKHFHNFKVLRLNMLFWNMNYEKYKWFLNFHMYGSMAAITTSTFLLIFAIFDNYRAILVITPMIFTLISLSYLCYTVKNSLHQIKENNPEKSSNCSAPLIEEQCIFCNEFDSVNEYNYLQKEKVSIIDIIDNRIDNSDTDVCRLLIEDKHRIAE